MKVHRTAVLLGFLAAAAAPACTTNVKVFDDPPGPDPQCQGFDDETGQAVTLRVRNDGFADIFLPGLCGEVSYGLVPVGGDDGVHYGSVQGVCLQTCEELQTSERLLCQADACAPTAIRVRPGETRDIVWGGTGLDHGVEMPGACWFDFEAGGSCSRVVTAPPGDYRVDLPAYNQCGNGDCECDVDGTVCWGDPSGATAFPVLQTLTVPGAPVFELVFDECAFGCAEDQ